MSIHNSIAASFAIAGFALASAIGASNMPPRALAADAVEPGRFVWRDLMTKDVEGAKQFYGELFGWRFEHTRRGDRPYVLARAANVPIAGLVDISSIADAGAQWLSYMSVTDVDKSVAFVQAERGKVLVAPRDLPIARVAVVTDPEGAPLGLAQLRQSTPDPSQPSQHQFFWQEYLARNTEEALAFYTRLAGYKSELLESRLDVDYYVLRATRGRAGLFRLPTHIAGVEPNWLPYVLVDDPAALGARVSSLGGRVVVPAAPERRNGSLVVIADPGGAVLALQKFPF